MSEAQDRSLLVLHVVACGHPNAAMTQLLTSGEQSVNNPLMEFVMESAFFPKIKVVTTLWKAISGYPCKEEDYLYGAAKKK